MSADVSKIIVTPGEPVLIQHRDFPEIRAEGRGVPEASQHLQNQLSRALDSALTDWRRESIQNAISDLKAFLATASTPALT